MPIPHVQLTFVVYQNQNMQTEINEHGGEPSSTEVQGGNGTKTSTSPEITEYKAVTLRAKANTVEFFDRIHKVQNEKNLNVTESSTLVLSELLDAQRVHIEQQKELATLIEKSTNAEKRIIDLEVQLEEQKSANSGASKLPENSIVVIIDPLKQKLFEKIALNRFNNEEVRRRYKLSKPESIGELLINCIATQEILFNYNECFFTGLSKATIEQHLKNR